MTTADPVVCGAELWGSSESSWLPDDESVIDDAPGSGRTRQSAADRVDTRGAKQGANAHGHQRTSTDTARVHDAQGVGGSSPTWRAQLRHI